MSEMQENYSGNPWRFCGVCRRHHEQGRKHIFTIKHKTKLNAIITKFTEKVQCARQQVQKPSVMDGELEPDATLWCYFCELEVMRHVTDRLTTVVWGGLLEHMASIPHHKKTRHFWWVNGADKKHLQNFLLFEAEYRRYKELVREALQRMESNRELKLKEELRQKEFQQHATMEPPTLEAPPTIIYTTVRNKHGVLQNPTGWHEGRRVWGGGIVKYKGGSDQLLFWPIDNLINTSSGRVERRGKMTVSATGDHLTAIQYPAHSEGEGNVHSGATPPWLRDEGEEEENDRGGDGVAPVGIGPSEEEFLRHRKHTSDSKRKNSRRVGADFHLKQQQMSSTDTKEWFPSFGRVWNSGPRSHSLAEFHRERPSSSASTSKQVHHSHAIATSFPLPHSSDMPGPSGLHRHSAVSSTSSSSPAGPLGSDDGSTAHVQPQTSILPPGVLLEDVRPYVRKRRRKSDKSTKGK